MAVAELTAPFVGATAPMHVTGVAQVVPTQPTAAEQSQTKPIAPDGVQVPPFWHGLGVQPVAMKVQVGALPDHVIPAWHVRVGLPDWA